ncbi:MAG: NADH:ubiquinone oxidoreductase subunit A [Nitrospirae bacterium GWD2_57_9]|nr:MAG: NADH:ubiquinone oxidoreductase subunit A [Nitrospirae bacterium GWD2_57_9]OGW45979.1 MAG: NADH:ubiquinone oxidoreductase subunit A [Nitrospirae bacterium GWC2_57_9]
MITPDAQTQPLWPLAVYFGLVIILIASMIIISHFLGERHREKMTDMPYESGVSPTGSARLRFHIQFYLIAMFFVVFDLEAVFVYAWAVSIRENGWTGYAEMTIFIGILAASLAYLWRVRALDWRTDGKARP